MGLAGFFAANTVIEASNPLLDGFSTVTLDAVIKEGAEFSATATDHPVEDGLSVTDHIRDEPDTLTLEAMVSRTPVMLGPLLLTEFSYRQEEAFWRLLMWLKSKTLLSVKTSVMAYDNLALVKLSRPRSAELGEVAQFTLSFKQIVKVASAMVAMPPVATGVQGHQQSMSATPNEADPASRSILDFLLSGGG